MILAGLLDFELGGELAGEGWVHWDAWAHRAAHGERSDVATLCGRRLSLDERTEGGLEVLKELLVGEVHLSDGHVDDTGFVGSVFNTGSGFDFANGGGDVVRNRSVSLVRRSGAEDSSDLTDLWSHFFRGEKDIEVAESALDLSDQVFVSNGVGACIFCSLGEVSLGKDGNLSDLSGSVWKVGDTANVLVALLRVNSEDNADVDGFDELSGCGLLYQSKGSGEIELRIFVDLLGNSEVTRRMRVCANVLLCFWHSKIGSNVLPLARLPTSEPEMIPSCGVAGFSCGLSFRKRTVFDRSMVED